MIDHFHNKYLQPTFIYFSNSDHSLHSRGESLLVWWVPRGEGRASVDITVDAKFTFFAKIRLPPRSTLESGKMGRWRNPEEVSTVSFINPRASRSGTFQVRRRTCLVSAIFPNNWQRKIRLRRRVLENHFEVANRFLFQHILSNIKGCGWRVDQYVPPLPPNRWQPIEKVLVPPSQSWENGIIAF